jgi:uncharacterized delta-60 repeat protein
MNISLALTPLLLVLATTAALACPSDPDPTFGEGGIATGLPAGTVGTTYDIAIANDGSIVTAGFVDGMPTLLRYTPGGELDTAFGDGGFARLNVFGDFNSIAFQEDGSIVAAGDVGSSVGSNLAIVLARFDESGQLDTQFGDGGVTITGIGPQSFSRDLLLRSDGKIVVSGQGTPGDGSWRPFVLFYTPDGDLDPAFGNDGVVGIGSLVNAIASSAIETDDLAIVVAGIQDGSGDTYLARLAADGTLDESFGNGGIRVFHTPRKYEEAWRVGKDADGRIYVSGNTTALSGIHTRLFVRRVLQDGQRDRSYAEGGLALLRFRQELAPRGLAVADDGAVTVPAWFVSGRGSFLARLTGDGDRDPAFGRNGVERFRISAATRSHTSAATQFHQVARQDDGAILVTGTANLGPLLMRLEGGEGDESCAVEIGDSSTEASARDRAESTRER